MFLPMEWIWAEGSAQTLPGAVRMIAQLSHTLRNAECVPIWIMFYQGLSFAALFPLCG